MAIRDTWGMCDDARLFVDRCTSRNSSIRSCCYHWRWQNLVYLRQECVPPRCSPPFVATWCLIHLSRIPLCCDAAPQSDNWVQPVTRALYSVTIPSSANTRPLVIGVLLSVSCFYRIYIVDFLAPDVHIGTLDRRHDTSHLSRCSGVGYMPCTKNIRWNAAPVYVAQCSKGVVTAR